ncbi:helix-turn-helix domain-containing protein [Mycobacterium sp. UM_Kg1]|uniref:helix-turn-helix domain-containing protein n=1 Tax=Mycobacterium sp. UM_Kg1 TaxID=1545691 RepID=UPI0009E44923|nr:helix-turn-helix domain-containing protein [Mycobacterium sp. UM_Kg1]
MTNGNSQSLPARLSIKQAADHYGVCDKTIRRKIAEGELKAYRVGKRAIRVDRESLLALEKPMFV